MAKPVLLFFLSFCFLLLSGSSHLRLPVSFSKVYTVFCSHSGKENKAGQSGFNNHPTFQQPVSTDTSDDVLNGIEPKDDDDNSESSRKYLELTSFFLHFFRAPLTVDAHCYRKAALPACVHFARLASQKHILNRVIRI